MSIKLIYGPMFAGKTEHLIADIKEMEKNEESFLVIKHSNDSRSSGVIKSHIGHCYPAIDAVVLMDLKITPLQYHAIFIDEGQFFQDLYQFCSFMKQHEQRIIVAGLDLKFNKDPFGDILKLREISDELIYIKSDCSICGAEKGAIYSYLDKTKRDNKAKMIIGDGSIYKSVCPKCYDKLEAGQNNTTHIEIKF